MAATEAVENPDDAAEESKGNGARPCICHAQFGRACIPHSGLFFVALSCGSFLGNINGLRGHVTDHFFEEKHKK